MVLWLHTAHYFREAAPVVMFMPEYLQTFSMILKGVGRDEANGAMAPYCTLH